MKVINEKMSNEENLKNKVDEKNIDLEEVDQNEERNVDQDDLETNRSVEYDFSNPCHLPEEDCEIVVSVLREIYDPEVPVNVYDLGLIYDIRFIEEDDLPKETKKSEEDISSDDRNRIKDDDVKSKTNKVLKVTMTFTTPFCPVIGMIVQQIRDKLSEFFEKVYVEVVWDPPWNPDMIKKNLDEIW